MVSRLNNLIMLFIQTRIKSSFMHQIWRLRSRGDACHFYSYYEGIFVTVLMFFLPSLNMKVNYGKQRRLVEVMD